MYRSRSRVRISPAYGSGNAIRLLVFCFPGCLSLRKHSETWAGRIVSCTTASKCPRNWSRSTSSSVSTFTRSWSVFLDGSNRRRFSSCLRLSRSASRKRLVAATIDHLASFSFCLICEEHHVLKMGLLIPFRPQRSYDKIVLEDLCRRRKLTHEVTLRFPLTSSGTCSGVRGRWQTFARAHHCWDLRRCNYV